MFRTPQPWQDGFVFVVEILKRIFIGLLIALAVIFAGVFIFLQLSKPTLNGELVLSGLQEDVEVVEVGQIIHASCSKNP